MKFLVVVSPPSIYHGCSTRKTFWEEKFTGKKKDLVFSVNMRNCGQRNVSKHKEIKYMKTLYQDENNVVLVENSVE